MIRRGEDVSYEVQDDGGILYNVERMANGSLTASVRVYGHVTIDGKEYSYDRNEVRVRLKRSR